MYEESIWQVLLSEEVLTLLLQISLFVGVLMMANGLINFVIRFLEKRRKWKEENKLDGNG